MENKVPSLADGAPRKAFARMPYRIILIDTAASVTQKDLLSSRRLQEPAHSRVPSGRASRSREITLRIFFGRLAGVPPPSTAGRLTLLLQHVINARFAYGRPERDLNVFSGRPGANSDAAKLQPSVLGFAVEACSEFRRLNPRSCTGRARTRVALPEGGT